MTIKKINVSLYDRYASDRLFPDISTISMNGWLLAGTWQFSQAVPPENRGGSGGVLDNAVSGQQRSYELVTDPSRTVLLCPSLVKSLLCQVVSSKRTTVNFGIPDSSVGRALDYDWKAVCSNLGLGGPCRTISMVSAPYAILVFRKSHKKEALNQSPAL